VIEPWLLAVALKPLGLIILFCFVRALVLPLRRMPDCRAKRILFFSWKV
jgi:hypothetical protein